MNKNILFNTTSKTNGHGSYRKDGKKLLGTLALAGAVAVAGVGSVVSADETAPAQSAPASQVSPQTVGQANTQPVAVDNTTVETAAINAQNAGVEVTQEPAKDMGVAQNDQDLANKQAEIAADQANQVQSLQEAQKQATETNQAYQEAKQAVETTNEQADQMAKDHRDYVAEVKTEPVDQGKTPEAYHKVADKADEIQKQNQSKVDSLNKQLAAYLNSTDFKANMTSTTQDVDDLEFGDSFMKATVDSQTGAFSLTHDMNDNGNTPEKGLGNLGTGVLTGKLNWHSESNGDGTQNITLDSVRFDKYVYTNLRPSIAVNNDARLVITDPNKMVVGADGKEHAAVIYDSGIYNVNNNLDQAINQTIAVNKTFKVGPKDQTALFQAFNVDDDWVHDTHGQIYVQFETDNKEPGKITLVKLTDPAEPEVRASYHTYQLAMATPAPQPGQATPTPQKTPAQPAKAAVLPQTGDQDSVGAVALGAIFVGMSALGAARFKLKTKETD